MRGQFYLIHAGSKGRVLCAARAIVRGQKVLLFAGEESDRSGPHSLQVGRNVHLSESKGFDDFVSHSCNPNCRAVEFETGKYGLRALRDIAVGEEITFNYNTTEYELDPPFDCLCNAEDCIGRVQGYKHLTPAQRRAIIGITAEHLLNMEVPNADVHSPGAGDPSPASPA